MKRKLIKQGIGALTITLPKEWISKYNLKAGDEIEMEEIEKNLLLRTEGKRGILRKITIDIDNLNQVLIWRYLTSAYRLGYDEITLKFSNIEKNYDIKLSSLIVLEKKAKMSTLEVIQDIVNRFVGLEIIDHEKNYCVIKDLGETSEKDFEITLRRIFLLLLSMTEESLLGLKKAKNTKNIVRSIDINVDKFTDFCLRVLNKMGYKKSNKTNSIYSIIILLEFIGDEYKKISIHTYDSKLKIDSKLINIHEDINKFLNLFYELFYKFNEKRIAEIYDLDEQLTNEINSLKLNNEEKEILHHLKKIKRYITDLVQLRIDFEI